jgi:hypothetical protein
MALVLADRVQQTGTANTTISFTLSGSVTGFQSFTSGIGNGNTTYYSAFDTSGNWETGLGAYSTTGPTLTRTTIYQSSNSNAAVTFSGTVNVFVTYPAGKSVNQDVNSNVSNNSFIPGWATTATAAGTTTLTVSSAYYQRFTGSTTQTVVLPDATTVAKGQGFIIDNDASGNLTLQDGAAGALGVAVPGMAAFVFNENNSTTAGSWSGYMFVPGGGPSGQVTWGTAGLSMGGQTITGAGAIAGTSLSATNGIIVNNQTVAANYTIPTGYSASSVGPVTVSGGVSVTVPTGSRWLVL